MVDAILQRWPCIVHEQASYEDSQTIWKARLRTHFKNARYRHGDDIPCIIANAPGQEIAVKKACRAWGIPNYLPDCCEGEDEASQEIHVTRLVEQSKLSELKQNAATVQLSMNKTFADRQQLIVHGMARMADVLQKYPILSTEKEVSDLKCVIVTPQFFID